MKKIILLALICAFFSHSILANHSNKPPAKGLASDEFNIEISPTMQIVSNTKHDEDTTLGCTIESKFPQIQGTSLSLGAKEFNTLVEKTVNEEINQFKKSVALDAPHMKTLPENIRQNTLKVDYDVDIIQPKTGPIISVRLTFEGMQAGRAHPYHNNRVVNFDLQTGKVITLNELFKKNSNFLKLLAAYTSKALNQKLKQDNWMVQQGTKANVSNFKNWNLQSDSLLITFDEYQVAPYVYGSQEVEVPYSELKKVLSSESPIVDCVKNPTSCQSG